MDYPELPQALVKRIAKAKVAQLEAASGRPESRNVQISKDALTALSESARVFIHFATAMGNQICKESKRQVMNMDDVLTAVEDIDFADIVPSLKEALEVYKAESKEKKERKAGQKRKLEDEKADAAAVVELPQAEPQPQSQPQVAAEVAPL